MKNPDRQYYFGLEKKRLFVQEWGSVHQPVILLVHGFPGCAEHGKLLTSTPLLDQFRLISFDRPGYGRSSHQKKLTPLILANQIKNLIDSLQIQNLNLLSVSGGAPYAMALGYLMKERILKITSVAGVAPLTRRNFRYMSDQQRKAWLMRNLIPGPLLEFGLKKVWASGLDKLDQLLFKGLDNFSQADQKVFSHPSIGPELLETIKISLAQGPGGILQDMKVYSKSWGFKLSEIKCPITLWHGRDDDIVNMKYTEEMSQRLPQSKVNLISGEGHYSLPMNYRDAILNDLLLFNLKS